MASPSPQETSKGTGRRRSFSWVRGEERWASSKPSSWRVDDSQLRPNSRRLQMQGYCRSAQRTQSTARFTCCPRRDLEGVTWYREASAPAGGRPARFRLRSHLCWDGSTREKRVRRSRPSSSLATLISCRTRRVARSLRMSARALAPAGHRTRSTPPAPNGERPHVRVLGRSPRESIPLLFRNTLTKRSTSKFRSFPSSGVSSQ